MKYLLMNAVMVYVVACADGVDGKHSFWDRIGRALLWPVTVTSWFVTQNIRLHRLLNILWTILIAGWFLSLLADRL